jgi:formylglycine-generating enzyme required for sulfatase activity
VKPFAIGKTEVTKAQWDTCVRLSGKDLIVAATNSDQLPYGCEENKSGLELSPKSPIVHVSHTEAIGYIRWLNYMTNGNPDIPYRLPSEAEWEYAARAETTTIYPWGSKENDVCKYANLANPETVIKYSRVRDPYDCPKNYLSVSPVSSFQHNKFGLFDMQGNAWEWTEDCRRDNLTEKAFNYKEKDCSAVVIRGGAWDTSLDTMRSSYRFWYDRNMSGDTIGFRVARDIGPEK